MNSDGLSSFFNLVPFRKWLMAAHAIHADPQRNLQRGHCHQVPLLARGHVRWGLGTLGSLHSGEIPYSRRIYWSSYTQCEGESIVPKGHRIVKLYSRVGINLPDDVWNVVTFSPLHCPSSALMSSASFSIGWWENNVFHKQEVRKELWAGITVSANGDNCGT